MLEMLVQVKGFFCWAFNYTIRGGDIFGTLGISTI